MGRFNLESKSKCPVCGEPVSVKNQFCPHCGAKLHQKEPSSPNSAEGNIPTKPTESVDNFKVRSTNSFPQGAHSNKYLGAIIAFVVIALLGLWITKPWVPKGLKSPDSVMVWVYDHAHNKIDLLAGYSGLDSAMRAAGEGEGGTQNDVRIYLMRNAKSKNYVFKLKHHYIYLVKISNGDSYYEAGIGVNKDRNGNVYNQQLSKSQMDQVDPNAEEDYWWTSDGFDDFGSN